MGWNMHCRPFIKRIKHFWPISRPAVLLVALYFNLPIPGLPAEVGDKSADDKRNHWAFKAPVRPAPPSAGQPRWVRNPIDNFILARLEKEKLKPSPEAERNVLIRRLSLDLTDRKSTRLNS